MMKVALSLCFLLCCAAQLALPSGLAAQQAISTPGSGKALGPGFSWGSEGGIYRSASGQWVAREYPKVAKVKPASAAARAGVREGDVIVFVDGRDSRQLPVFRGLRPGSTIVLRIRRGDDEREIKYQLETK